MQRQDAISFEEYKNVFPLQRKEVIDIIELYIREYQHYKRKTHPPLRHATWEGVLASLSEEENSLSIDEHREMILKHFKTKYSKPIDYNICHYVTEGILKNRFFETCY